jgi:hypothetical protein
MKWYTHKDQHSYQVPSTVATFQNLNVKQKLFLLKQAGQN